MNKLILAALSACVFACAGFSSKVFAGSELDTLNAEVEQQAMRIDEQYGVLLTESERSNLKIRLIVSQLAALELNGSNESVQKLVEDAYVTFDITDPYEQRQLLIETQAVTNRMGGGTKPKCCN